MGTISKKNPIKGYKAFNRGMECRGFEYEVGKEYHQDGKIIACENGFHFCENPLNILDYYDICNVEFAEVEGWGKWVKRDDKIAVSDIRIKKKIDLPEFIKASFAYLIGKGGISLSSTDFAQIASSGDEAKRASSGDFAQIASSGYGAQIASSGYGAKLASSGDGAQIASSGYGAKLASSGYGAKIASSGDFAKLASSGDDTRLVVDGENSIGANIGARGKASGKIGNWIVLAEYKDGRCVNVKAAQIDGETIKEDTWYELVNNEFIHKE
jgi:hypothetical protein